MPGPASVICRPERLPVHDQIRICPAGHMVRIR